MTNQTGIFKMASISRTCFTKLVGSDRGGSGKMLATDRLGGTGSVAFGFGFGFGFAASGFAGGFPFEAAPFATVSARLIILLSPSIPPRHSGLPSAIAKLFRGQLCSARWTALQPTAPAERDSEWILPV